MSDPRIVKDIATIKTVVKYEDQADNTNLYTLVSKKIIEEVPQTILETKIKENLTKISLKPGTVMKSLITSFSYAEEGALDGFDFGNVLVQANLPYCLKIPDFMKFNVVMLDQNIEAMFTAEKIWTNRSHDEEKKSETIDFYTDDHPIYFKQSSILSPRMPLNPEEGWEPYITGRNIENIEEQNGIFRYSRIHLQLKYNVKGDIARLNDKQQRALLDDISDKSLSVINRVIDNYRDITSEIYVRRLSDLSINMIYFIEQDKGFYLLPLPLRTAMINRSLKEIKNLAKNLNKGEKPPTYKMLLLNAKDLLRTKEYTLAIVESFQALEVFLENYLIELFVKRGDAKAEYEKHLKKHWETKKRLNIVLNDLKGRSLNKETALWDQWCTRYDKTRNEVIHNAKEPSKNETEETLRVNEAVINWLMTI